ncbi:ethanolamine ammonia-lyase subunit EutC [Salinisphaera sp.]|uniref:ethanolamine ammonia-lyase subunit EutC n=1 Tax=Salinisphaera sp. TaxID=1914330 RepID=UPI000C4F41E0|nr:ethanolamine ammonia-lyase subunit EutC [Salinisphaera sp.]MBS62715.1 ethanolamine ammonia-lyase [Salinisphaera sp.]
MSDRKPRTPADTAGDDIGVVDNPWQGLRAFTDARIGLGRAGISLPTQRMLEFQLAHAQARDAVHWPLNVDALSEQLTDTLGIDAPLRLHSQAGDRTEYLQRPDLGRRLDEHSRKSLQETVDAEDSPFDLALVIVDGLSARAIEAHAVTFLAALSRELDADDNDWRRAPLTVVEQGRVAIGDEVGEAFNARAVLVLIGERPGLSSPDSLGLYLTWAPKRGVSDGQRNCISNVRPEGLKIEVAASRARYLLNEARRLELSGVKLKDRSEDDVIDHDKNETGNFLTY